jgi:hypothetical protein
MMVEISLIQRFVLFLGQPVLSLAVLLSSLLGGAGVGSIGSGYVGENKTIKGCMDAALLTALILLIYAYTLSSIFNRFLGLAIEYRVLIAIVLLLPLGAAMGFPLPLAIRSLNERQIEHVIPWMWGINGTSSVLGSAATITIAIYFGFTQVLLIGVGCYLMIFLILKFERFDPISAKK